MRILISALSCNPALGSEALVGFKCAEVLARKHEVTVLASPPSQAPPGVSLVPCDVGPCTFNEIGPVPLLRFELRQFLLARRLCKHQRFDLVHRVTPSAIQVPTWAARLGAPCVIGPLIAADPAPPAFRAMMNRPVSRPSRPRWHPARVGARLCALLVDRAAARRDYLRRAHRIIVGTRTALRHVPESLRDKCVSITYAGVEHERFLPPTLTRLQSPISNLQSPLRLLFVGRLIPYKGVELLLRALAVAALKCELQLDLVGSGGPVFTRYCQELAHSLGLAEIVNFIPHVPRAELPRLYQKADIFCFPTLCDTYGIALLEAMSCGCAVVVSDVAGAGEIVAPGTGIKVPLTDPDQYIRDYAEALIGLAGNADLRVRLGIAARQHILRNHDWDKIGAQVLQVYEELEPAQ